MAENTREIVLDILLCLERGEEYSHRLLRAVLDKYDYLPGQEKAFIKRLAEGCVERQTELDYVLDLYSSVPVRKMKPLIRCLMRMGVYQLLYMDAIPDSAVCNEAVKLAGKRKFQNLKGFVNGVLRSIAREKGRIIYPDPEKEPSRFLSVRYSMPEWIVSMWLSEYGEERTKRLLEGLLEIHPVSIRFASRLDKNARQEYIAQMEKAGVRVTPSPYAQEIVLLQNTEGIAALPGYEEGAFTVQDVSSALSVMAAGIQKTDFVLDICAAPGGKSLFASEKADRVLARDVSEGKIARIEENRERLRAENLYTQVWDACVTDETMIEKADVVIADVPCSGLGVMGKKRDIKYHISEESLKSLRELQKQIIRASWKYVKPGGILLYSTCTVRHEENQDMRRFIEENFPFEAEDMSAFLPEKLRERGKSGELQLFPGEDGCDGFYFARLRRRG